MGDEDKRGQDTSNEIRAMREEEKRMMEEIRPTRERKQESKEEEKRMARERGRNERQGR